MKNLCFLLLVAGLFLSADFGTGSEARAGYPRWLRDGDVYQVTGRFAGQRRSFTVQVSRRGRRFYVLTPLGAHRLRPAGAGVTFRVYFEGAWARVRWVRGRASAIYKKRRGRAVLRRLGRAPVYDTRRIQLER